MRKPMTARITELTVAPEGEPLFSEQATVIKMVDHAAGEYVEVKQEVDGFTGTIALEPHTWPEIRRQIDAMINGIRTEHEEDA